MEEKHIEKTKASNKEEETLQLQNQLLICPNCREGIPMIDISSDLMLTIKCKCIKSQPLDLTIPEYISKIQNDPNPCNCFNHETTKAIKFCCDCSKWYCQECLDQYLNEERIKKSFVVDYQMNIVCPEHLKPFELYSNQKNKYMCNECLKEEKEEEEKDEKEKEALSYFNSFLTKKRKTISDSLQLYEESLKLFSEENEELLKTIQQKTEEKIPSVDQLKKFKEKIKTSLVMNKELRQFIQCFQTTAGLYQNCDIPQLVSLLNNITKQRIIENINMEMKVLDIDNTILTELSDGRLAGFLNKRLTLWNLNREKCYEFTDKYDDNIVNLIELSDGELASWSDDYTIRVWNITLKQCRNVFKGHSDKIRSMVDLSNGDLVSWAYDQTIRLWNRLSGECNTIMKDDFRFIKQLRNEIFATTNCDDNEIRLLDVKNGKFLYILKGHTDKIQSLLKLSNGDLASNSYDHTIRIWNISSGECTKIINDDSNNNDLFIELSNKQFAISQGSRIKIINYSCNKECVNYLDGHTDDITDIIELSDGQLVSMSEDDTIRFWNTSGKCIRLIISFSIIKQLKNSQYLYYSGRNYILLIPLLTVLKNIK